MISKRVKHMDASGIRKAFALGRSLKDPIDLSIGQPCEDVPEAVCDVAVDSIRRGENRYTQTQGIDALRDTLAKKLKREGQINCTQENVLVTSAVSGALSVTLPAVIDPGDEVLLFDPCFVGYKQLVLLYGGKPKMVPRNDNFSVNTELLEQSVTKRTKAIVFSSPENPTGYVYTKEELSHIARIAHEHDLTVFSDEIYAHLTYKGSHVSIGTMYKNTVVVNGFSKSHAMTGWRVGYASGPTEIIEEAMKVQQFTFVCAPTPFQHAAIKALTTSTKSAVRAYKAKRDMVYKGLKDLYDVVLPQGAFYFFIRYPYNGKEFIERCLEHNLIVVPGSSFSTQDTHFRISYATDTETLEKAIDILRTIATK